MERFWNWLKTDQPHTPDFFAKTIFWALVIYISWFLIMIFAVYYSGLDLVVPNQTYLPKNKTTALVLIWISAIIGEIVARVLPALLCFWLLKIKDYKMAIAATIFIDIVIIGLICGFPTVLYQGGAAILLCVVFLRVSRLCKDWESISDGLLTVSIISFFHDLMIYAFSLMK